MKKTLAILVALFTFFLYTEVVYAAPSSSAQAFAVMEASTGRLLYAGNADAELPMASTTKIMTTLVALENGDLDQMITVPKSCVGVEGSSLYVKEGEEYSLRDLLYGLMLRSGNDAAETIAVGLTGSVDGFVELMNQKAAELGCTGTHFVNPHGLTAEGHYTTARDLAKITSAAMQNGTFREITGAKSWKITTGSNPRVINNKNKMLWEYEGANGGKTGYTSAAGRCLVSTAERDGMQLVCVVLNCSPMFEDSKALLDEAFANYHWTKVLASGETMAIAPVENGRGESGVPAVTQSEVWFPLLDGERARLRLNYDVTEARAPVKTGDSLGTITLTLDEDLSATVPMASAADVEKEQFGDYVRKVMGGWKMFQSSP